MSDCILCCWLSTLDDFVCFQSILDCLIGEKSGFAIAPQGSHNHISAVHVVIFSKFDLFGWTQSNHPMVYWLGQTVVKVSDFFASVYYEAFKKIGTNTPDGTRSENPTDCFPLTS